MEGHPNGSGICTFPGRPYRNSKRFSLTMATITRQIRLSCVTKASSALMNVLTTQHLHQSNPVIAAGCLFAGGLLLSKMYDLKYRNAESEISKAVDREVEELAAELVEDGIRVAPTSDVMVVYNATGRTGVVPALDVTSGVVGCVNYITEPIETKLHRKVARHRRSKYTNLIVAECKLVFGVPKNTEANYKAVRRTAVKLMKNHGVRPAHANTMLPKIVEMVFMPSCHELEAKRLANSGAAWVRVTEFLVMSGLNPAAWFSDGG